MYFAHFCNFFKLWRCKFVASVNVKIVPIGGANFPAFPRVPCRNVMFFDYVF